MTVGIERRARGIALAVLSALLTTTGHVAAGGAPPDLALLIVLVPMLCTVNVALAERAPGAVGDVLTLAAGQLVLHHLLALLHPAHPAGPAAFDGREMLAMHAVATVATVLAVRYADAAVGAVRTALRRVLPRRPTLLAADRPLPAAVPAARSVGRRLAGALAAAHVRRGPPVRC